MKSAPKLVYRRPTDDDLRYLAENLRPSDVAELGAARQTDILPLLRESVAAPGSSVVVEWRGEPAAVFGVVRSGTLLSPYGVPWMLGTTLLYSMGRTFWTESKRVLYAMQEDYDELQNYVWAGSTVSIRWLKRLGFHVGPPLRWRDTEFCKFEWRRDDV